MVLQNFNHKEDLFSVKYTKLDVQRLKNTGNRHTIAIGKRGTGLLDRFKRQVIRAWKVK